MGRDILTSLVLYLKFSNRLIEGVDGPFEIYTSPMVDLVTYEFKDLDAGNITPEEYFTDAYVEELFELEHLHTSNKILCIILDDKYLGAYVNKLIKNRFQNLTEDKRIDLLIFFQKSEILFDVTPSAWKIGPVDI